MSAHDEQQAKAIELFVERRGGGLKPTALDKALLAGASALRRASPETGWREISKAEDGVEVWAWDRVDGYYSAVRVRVQQFNGVGKASTEVMMWHNKSANRYSKPTHWQPLPPAPPEVPHA